MKVERSKEWWMNKARQETGEVGAGVADRVCRHCGRHRSEHDKETRRCPGENPEDTSFWPVGEPGGG